MDISVPSGTLTAFTSHTAYEWSDFWGGCVTRTVRGPTPIAARIMAAAHGGPILPMEDREPYLVPGQFGAVFVTDANKPISSFIEEKLKDPSGSGNWAKKDATGEIIVNAPYFNSRATLGPAVKIADYESLSTSTARLVGVGYAQPTTCGWGVGGIGYTSHPPRKGTEDINTVRQDYIDYKGATLDPDFLEAYRSELTEWLSSMRTQLGSIEVNTGMVTGGASDLNQGAWDVATEIAEMRETVSFLYDAIRDAIRLSLGFKKKAAKLLSSKPKPPRERTATSLRSYAEKSAEYADRLSNLRLQYRYAITPLIYSINDIQEYLGPSSVYRTVRRRDERQLILNTPFGTVEAALSQRYFGKARLDAVMIARNANSYGINVASAIWEITPWSFVIDWAFNIGDWLGTLSAPAGVAQTVHLVSNKVVIDTKVSIDDVDVPFFFEGYRVDHINPTGLGIAFRSKMNDSRWMDALALSWQAFRRTLI